VNAPALTCDGVTKVFESLSGSIEALASIDLTVATDEFVCVIGPSGCGKSTLLRIIGGITTQTSGTITFGRTVEPARPRTAMVFQDHGLFPWMDVLDNIAFALETRGIPQLERRAAAMQLVERIGLERFASSFPHQLSGGMRQRVGIARALLADPQLLLMDEPFGALDAQTKLVMQEELLATWESQRREVLYVTHDLTEALWLGDRIVVLSGRPATVVADLPIVRRRPRSQGFGLEPDLEVLRNEVWSLLEMEARRHAQR
jgi:NitT/TauT family transport system ATP-binding protein